MSEQEVAGRLRLVRFGGILITAMVFGTLLAFSLVFSGLGVSFGQLLIYIVAFTAFAAIVSIALYYGYRAMLRGRMAKA